MSAARKARGPKVRVLTATAVALTVALVVLFAAAGWLLFGRAETNVAKGQSVTVTIPKGASTRAIAEELASAGVVANPNAFRVWARLTGADGTLRPGTYPLETGTSYGSAIDELKQGPPSRFVMVTIPEGFTIERIASRLEDQAGIPADEFAKLAKTGADRFADEHPVLKDAYKGSLEGYLFPKTYSVPYGDAEGAIEIMLDQFDTEFAAVDRSYAASKNLTDHDVVVLASMIERETRLAKERPLVSSVIYNRLSRGMKLEIDATIEYVLPGNRFRLSYADTRIDSPYNTYRNKGLPPGAIASPGLDSLRAAADPADTDYVYYVLTKKDGSHTFATNKAAFLKAKQRSKEVFGR